MALRGLGIVMNVILHEQKKLKAGRGAVGKTAVLGEGNVKHHTMTRLDSFVKGTAGKRLTYKGLIQ